MPISASSRNSHDDSSDRSGTDWRGGPSWLYPSQKTLSDSEIDRFLDDLDANNDGVIEYADLERKLDEIYREIAPKPLQHHLHHPSQRDQRRHRFLRSIAGLHGDDRIPRGEFAQIVRSWRIPSIEQDQTEETLQGDYVRSLPLWRRFRSYWAVRGPSLVFLGCVVVLIVGLGLWQMIKYIIGRQYQAAFGWGVAVAKFCAGALYPTFFLLLLSMSRGFSTLLRNSYLVSRFINWDRGQSFHIKLSILALALATLHAVAHLSGTFAFGSRLGRQNAVAALLGQDVTPRPYHSYIISRPGWTGITALALFWTLAGLSSPLVRKRNYELFQLGHLLMFPIIGLLIAHGTASLLQSPMLSYWLAFPTLLVLVERLVRLMLGFHRLPALLELLDQSTVRIQVTVPKERLWKFKAGQYVLLQVPEISLLQWHPFTVSTCAGNTFQVHIKADGDWTEALRDIATMKNQISVGVNGPFGAPAQRFYDFDQAFIVGAGIGVTPFAGILADLQAQENLRQLENEKWGPGQGNVAQQRPADYQGRPSRRRVDFHWSVRDRNNLLWFSDLLNDMSRWQSAAPTSLSSPCNLTIRIHTHITQRRTNISTHVYRWLLEMHRTDENPESPLTGLLNPTHFGRPDLVRLLDEHYQDMRSLWFECSYAEQKRSLKVGVFFCGAPVVGYLLADRCKLLSARARAERTRIEYYFMMEVFG